ncbi:cytochrome P450 [Lentzea rhizosphaerae]|uniref:Cytochrome P450 n=1 Tax=Lentzea rhizosphaerae TaxID=2041025 RepID=A0ABV8BLM1_9PSEU
MTKSIETPSLFSQYGQTDPYPLYRRLRELGPVHWDEWMRTWIVLGHQEITQLSKDPRLSGARIESFYEQLPASARTGLATLKDALAPMMLFNEPPRHTRLRQLLRPGLTPRFIKEIRSVITARVDELLDEAAERGGMDVIADFSEPLTRDVITQLAGVPERGAHLLESWQGLLHEFFTQSRREVPRIAALRGLFDEGAQARRDGTGTDLFTKMVSGQLARDEYTEDEIFANFLLLIDAGQATTTHLIGNAVLALVEHPDQQTLLRDQPSLAANAAHEFMRYDSSVQFTSRVALEDVEIAGHRIERDQSVALVLGAGNRDPLRYESPDLLDVTRKAHDHLSFGHGIHYCLGASLALAEIEIAISRLLQRFSSLTLVDSSPAWLESINFRFLKRLPITVEEQ